jgi:tetratricopeptide (TPR) repeat protein
MPAVIKPYALVLAISAFAAATPATTAAELTETDLAALRYFLSIDDKASVAAEIRRLETEFPGADVAATLALIDQRAREVDTSPIWREIEAEEFDAARTLIAEFVAENPGWSPPEDLVAILDANEGQAKFEAAVTARDLAAASEVVISFPSIVTCDRINNPWRLAELQVEAGLRADALATYDGILKTCGSEDYVVATLQKASAIAEGAEMAALFAVARSSSPALMARLTALETELAPAQASGDADAPAPAAATAAATPPPTRPSAPARTAPAVSRDAPASGGGQLARARAAADRSDWASCLELTANSGAIEMINQRSWCAFNFGRPQEALAGFKRVAAAGGGAMARDATYGMILAYARIGQPQAAADLASRAQLTAEQRRLVNRTVIADLAQLSFKQGKYRAAVSYLDQLSRDGGGLDRGLAMLRGWALLKGGNKRAAREQFQRVHQASPGNDSLQGLAETR